MAGLSLALRAVGQPLHAAFRKRTPLLLGVNQGPGLLHQCYFTTSRRTQTRTINEVTVGVSASNIANFC